MHIFAYTYIAVIKETPGISSDPQDSDHQQFSSVFPHFWNNSKFTELIEESKLVWIETS